MCLMYIMIYSLRLFPLHLITFCFHCYRNCSTETSRLFLYFWHSHSDVLMLELKMCLKTCGWKPYLMLLCCNCVAAIPPCLFPVPCSLFLPVPPTSSQEHILTVIDRKSLVILLLLFLLVRSAGGGLYVEEIIRTDVF